MIGFLLFGVFLALIRPRWYLRANWVLNNSEPVFAMVTVRAIESQNNRTLWAEIDVGAQPQSFRIIAGRSLKIPMLPAAKKFVDKVNRPQPATVYFDPQLHGPIVIKIDENVLWPALTSLHE